MLPVQGGPLTARPSRHRSGRLACGSPELGSALIDAGRQRPSRVAIPRLLRPRSSRRIVHRARTRVPLRTDIVRPHSNQSSRPHSFRCSRTLLHVRDVALRHPTGGVAYGEHGQLVLRANRCSLFGHASAGFPDRGRHLQRTGDAESVVNVGAGTGSYEPTDRRVVAVEPSPE
jgi:hypothetical protein